MHLHSKSKLALWAGPGALALLAAVNACSGKISSNPDGLGLGATGGSPAASGSGGTSGSMGGSTSSVAVGGSGGSGAQGGSAVIVVGDMGGTGATADPAGGAGGDDSTLCATVSTGAELEPVYLAFAFDVSGSMGNEGEAWYDPTLKWDPAVEATRSFLEDKGSTGLFASLTAFPINDDEESERCKSDKYIAPVVPMTSLPSTKFGEALDTIRATYWGNGTPTRPVLDGVMDFIDSYRPDHPGHYAIVLVTDGYPQQCDDINTIQTAEDSVRAHADEVPTYVIGVKNPPIMDDEGNSPPDTVSNLNGIADAGGTDSAFIIDTGDPQKTRTDFLKAVDAIRGSAISCSLDVPKAPDGRTFLKDHVVVSTTEGDETTDLTYDEECKANGAWHYDSTDKPTQVILCPDTCTELQDAQLKSASKAKVQVGFTCQPVIVIR
ncbi:MAG TPA: vWA domain-containing protein [Polyangiaceae bacterium]|nr:vWA domain-containing protein [Polyangiaceae bacterium]